jgi:HK97 family phage prohead protease
MSIKKRIKFIDYYKYLSDDTKAVVDAELSTSEVTMEDLVVKRVSGSEIKGFENDVFESSGYASTREIDFSGDLMVPEGISLEVFNKNPVIFYNHFTSNKPIGKALALYSDGYGLKCRIKYAVEEYEEAKTIYKLVKGGYINQHSIGFVPLQYVRRGDAGFDRVNAEMMEQYEEYQGNAKRIVTKALLLEVSIVNIADNQRSSIMDVKSLNTADYDTLKKYGLNIKEGERDESEAEKEKGTEVTDGEETKELEETIQEQKSPKREVKLIGEVRKPSIEVIKLPEKVNKSKIYSKQEVKMIKEATRKGIIIRK